MPPAVVAAAALIAGAVWGCLGRVPDSIAVATIAALVLAWVGFALRRPMLTVAAAASGFALCGAQLAIRADGLARDPPLRRALAAHLGQPPTEATPVWIEGRVRSDAETTDYGATVVIDVAAVRGGADDPWQPAAGGIRLSVGGTLAAGRVPELTLGRRVRVPVVAHRPQRYRNPGVPDQELALARRRLVLFASAKSLSLIEIAGLATRVEEWAAAARGRARRVLAGATRGQDTDAVAVVQAVLIGDRAGLGPEVQDRLQRAGTFHVIAISGGNIAVLAGVAMFVLGRLRLRPAISAMVGGAVVLAYGAFVLGGASVGRAVTVATLYFAARALDLRASPMALLGIAAASGLLADPLVVFDAGFALTFGATLGILVGVPRLVRWHDAARRPLDRGTAGRLERHLFGLGAATASAEIALLPVGAWAFSRVTFAGLALNFLAIPLMAVAQVAGLASVAVGLASDHAARLVATLAVLAARGLLESARLADLVPGADWRVPAPPAAVLCLYYAAWGGVLWPPWPFVRRAALAACAGALAWMLFAPAWPGAARLDGLGRTRPAPTSRRSKRWLSVTVFDVGQGDATLIRMPSGTAWLVDSGGIPRSTFDVGARVVVPAVWALGVRRLGSLVVTHAHPDHIGGAPSVVNALGPDVVREGIPVPGHLALDGLRTLVERAGLRWETMRLGQRLRDGDVEVRVVHPERPERPPSDVSNDDSVVLELRHGRVSIVLPGDIGRAVEPGVAARLGTVPLRIVKAPHHGSATSSTAGWIDALRPRVAIVSAGAGNRYRHPGRATLERYASRGVTVFRTDRDGAVTVESDGTRAVVRTSSGRTLRLAP